VVVEACAAAFERIGLPEGLYPLAQAALYLAATAKSNSALAFFDALKSVRATARQEVPSHLRDANRDGKLFGDGVGYRYPHAYAEHWVAQQYLPTALQGVVFWQPGPLGWEGERRRQLQEWRAAQLAAAAETAADQGELLSSSPADPDLERWLQRQAAAEGERLDLLRRRLWQGMVWRRHERVLLLGARSLLWALDPLEQAPEGGVMMQLEDEGTRARLEAQLQLLDSLRRPALMVLPTLAPQQFAERLERGAGPRFEWVAARQPWPDLELREIQPWLELLTPLISQEGGWRLLFSTPLLLPASAVAELNLPTPTGSADLIDQLRTAEAQLVSVQRQRISGVAAALTSLGWLVEEPCWQETLSLELSETLLQRWLAAGSRYRRELAAAGWSGPTTGKAPAALRRLLKAAKGQMLPQRLEHRLLLARRA
jgi:putative ATPase